MGSGGEASISDFVCRVELLKLLHGIDGEEAHVVGENEGLVSKVVLLLEDNLVTELLRKPGDILRSGQRVNIAREEHCRDVIVLKGHSWCSFLPVNLLVRNGSVVVQSEVARVDGLRVVEEGAPGLTSRDRAEAHLEPRHVIHLFIDKDVDENLAEFRYDSN